MSSVRVSSSLMTTRPTLSLCCRGARTEGAWVELRCAPGKRVPAPPCTNAAQVCNVELDSQDQGRLSLLTITQTCASRSALNACTPSMAVRTASANGA